MTDQLEGVIGKSKSAIHKSMIPQTLHEGIAQLVEEEQLHTKQLTCKHRPI